MPAALPLLCLAYCIGIGVGDALGLGARAGRLALGCALLGVVLGLWRGRGFGAAMLGLGLCLGLAAQARRPPPLPLPGAAPVLAQGRVEGGVEPGPAGTGLRVALERLQPAPGGPWQALDPPALVALTVHGAPREPLFSGDRVQLRAALRPPDGAHNPGAQDPRRRAAADGLQALATVDADALLRLAEGPERPQLRGAIGRLRARLLAHVEGRLGPGGVRAALVSALALGARGGLAALEPPLDETFRRAGVYHVLSVSGLHLAVASLLSYAALLVLLRRVPPLCRRVPARRLAALFAIPATLLYTALTGAAVATVRAAGVAVLCYGAIACGRRARLGCALAAALLWILSPLQAPLALFDPALQLSVAATLGTARLRPRGLRTAAGPGTDLVGRAAGAALGLLAATLGATLATAPLCALHFGELQGAGLLGNLVVVPLGELVVVPAGLLGALLSMISPALGGIVLDLAGAAALAMAALAEQVARLGLSAVAAAPSALALALWAAGLICLGVALGAAHGARRAWGAAGLLLTAALLVYLAPRALPGRALTATFLDVGQGDGAVLELPGGQVLVVDGGAGAGGYDPGERVLLPHLRRRGLSRVDLLIVSHPHPDHTAGLAAILEALPVGALWTAEADAAGPAGASTGGPPREPIDPSFTRLLALARRRGVPVERPRPLVLGGARIEPLGPCAPGDAGAAACALAPRPGTGHNDNSIVLRIEYAGRALLLPGDLELRGELRLLEHLDGRPGGAARRRVDVLKVPHHCSRTSSSESLLRELAPRLAVCSLGRRNRYGFPHREVLERYGALGIPLLRTDERGAVTVRLTAGGAIEAESVLGGPVIMPGPP